MGFGMRIVLLILAIYALVVLGAYIFQYRMLYFPDVPDLGEIERMASEAGLVLWPPDASDYRALVRAGSRRSYRGSVVVFHGNGGPAVQRLYYTAALEPLGWRVLLAEYPGYGGRPGMPGEKAFVADARETVRLVRQAFGGPVYLWGESLGCGVAAGLAADSRIDGLVLLTPWDSLVNVARVHYPYLPVRWLLKDRYDSVANLGQFKGPVAVIMAGRDTIIPNAATRNLYGRLVAPKRLWTFENAGHNNWPASPGLDWWREVMDFVSRKEPVIGH